MAETLCDSGAVKLKAGANVATLTGSQYTQLINQAEADIMASTRIDWVNLYSSLDAENKLILEAACSDKAGIYAISYDMSGYTSRAEAITMLNVLWASFTDALRVLKEDNSKTYLGGS